MALIQTAKQVIPAVIGEPWGGGYFGGYISTTADGIPTHALIVAPVATGQVSNRAWASGTYASTTVSSAGFGSLSVFDGPANMAILTSIGIAQFPAAEFCKNLTIGGFNDWYLGSPAEHDIVYSNLKPSTTANRAPSQGFVYGANPYAVPARTTPSSITNPVQTGVTLFRSGGAEAFGTAILYFTSRESGATQANAYSYSDNNYGAGGKTGLLVTRAFRRVAIS
jgi:hypothetical protein